MTDHQTQEGAGPVDAPTAEPVSDQEAMRDALFPQAADEGEAGEAPEDGEIEAETSEGETELEEADLEDDEEVEAETPTDAPVSLNAEEKEAFGQLPPEAQSFVTALEARRNADVTKVTTKAANAQREADARAAQAAVQAKQDFAQQLKAFTANFAPQRPDPALAETNPAQYVAQMAHYDAQIGHFQSLEDQIAGIGSEAQQESLEAFNKERDQALMQIPEIANEETRQDYLDRVFDPEFVSELGYERAELAQIADADDVKRLNTIAEWRSKAAKFDQAMGKRMKRVRQGKSRSTKPGVAQPNSSKAGAYNNSVANLKKTGSAKDAQAAFKAAIFN